VEINYFEIKGFGKMSKAAQEHFMKTYKKQTETMSQKEKLNWIPGRVKEYLDCIEVYFTSGEWLHYYADGTWG
jgi:hypothetical protein